MTEKTDEQDERRLMDRLIAAAGRIESSLYEAPVTLEDAGFRLLLCDALMAAADNVFKYMQEPIPDPSPSNGVAVKRNGQHENGA